MLPILISLGPVKIYSFGVCIALGLFFGLYWWWKMGRDEHFDEITLFDGFFMSLMIFLVLGRAGYVLANYSEMGTLYRSIAILSYPGVSGGVGLISVSLFTVLFARYHDWNVWKILDSFSVALSLVLIFAGLGTVLNGSNPAWQVNLWGLAWAMVSFVLVSRVRKNFRFYSWYKARSSMAQDGLAALVFGLTTGVYYLGLGLMNRLYLIMGLLIIVVSSLAIYQQAGRREVGIWSKLIAVVRRK